MQSVFCGGARVGASRFDAINYTYPFAKLTADERQCLITIKFLMFSKVILLKKEDVEKVEVYSGLFLRGIKFTHHNLSAPKYIVFWSFSASKIYDFLLSAGYKN